MFENVREDLTRHLLSDNIERFKTANELLAAALLLGHILHVKGVLEQDHERFELEAILGNAFPDFLILFEPLLMYLYETEISVNSERLIEFVRNVKMTAIYENLLDEKM